MRGPDVQEDIKKDEISVKETPIQLIFFFQSTFGPKYLSSFDFLYFVRHFLLPFSANLGHFDSILLLLNHLLMSIFGLKTVNVSDLQNKVKRMKIGIERPRRPRTLLSLAQ